MALTLTPSSDLSEVELLLNQSEDAFSLLARFGAPSFGGLKNVNNALQIAAAGGSLNPKDLLSIAFCLRAMRTLCIGIVIAAVFIQVLISFLRVSQSINILKQKYFPVS